MDKGWEEKFEELRIEFVGKLLNVNRDVNDIHSQII